jgi:hypothetical protein
LENKRDPEENPRSLYPARFALAPAGVPGLGASPGVEVQNTDGNPKELNTFS